MGSLNRILTLKLKHEDSDVRLEAVKELTDEDILIEIAKNDYRFIPSVYKSMMSRLEQGEYIIQNPVFSSLLNIKFPKPIYKQFKQ